MEREIQHSIRLSLGARTDVVMWRNNVGALKDARGRYVRFGLCEGSADLIGIYKPTGQFLAIEIKRPGGKLSEAQEKFAALVASCGGIHFTVFSADEAIQKLEGLCKK